MFHSTLRKVRRKRRDSRKTVIFQSQERHQARLAGPRRPALTELICARVCAGYKLLLTTTYGVPHAPKPQNIVTIWTISGTLLGLLRWVMGSHKAMQLSTSAGIGSFPIGLFKTERNAPNRRPSGSRSIPDIGSEVLLISQGRRPSNSTEMETR